jgi:hypothetical protein
MQPRRRYRVPNPARNGCRYFRSRGRQTGDHPTEQLAFKDGWVYWSQGSTTNSGVVGLDNGGGTNQSDIPCQDITLSDNVFISSLSPPVATSGYSPFGMQQKGAKIRAFFNSFTGQVRQGVCDGAVLRSRINDSTHAIEAFSWGYRNPYAIRFPRDDHPLAGGILAGEDGADERGARPSNNAPDALQLGRQNPRWQPGLSRMAGSLWLPADEPGGVQPDRWPKR